MKKNHSWTRGKSQRREAGAILLLFFAEKARKKARKKEKVPKKKERKKERKKRY